MDFLKKIFGGNANNVNSNNQENFVVDETGNAREASAASVTPMAPAPQNINPVSNPTPMTAPEPIVSQNPVAESVPQSEGEYVGDTSAFDELMKQAESSVDARVLGEPIVDPEFKKIQDEIKEEGIELFQSE